MTVSNKRRMFESSKVRGGGTSAEASASVAWSMGSLVVVSPVEDGGGMTPEGSTLGHLELALN